MEIPFRSKAQIGLLQQFFQQTHAEVLAWVWNGHMTGPLRMDIHVMQALHAAQYPPGSEHLLDELRACHGVYYPHR